MSDAMFWLSAGEGTVFPAKFLAGYLVMFQCSQPTSSSLQHSVRAISKFLFPLYTYLKSKSKEFYL
jgi:hypothetical protein